MIGDRIPADTGERRAVEEAMLRIDSLKALTEDLLLFTRPLSPELAPLCLGQLAYETALLRADRGLAGVTSEMRGDAGELRGDPRQLRTVLANLLHNAATAMEGKGRLVVDVPDRAGAVELHVSDNGPGVPAESRESILEPFFTTRARATGLGLAIVRTVVEAHGREVVSEPAPRGACFRVALPREAAPRLPPTGGPSRRSPSPREEAALKTLIAVLIAIVAVGPFVGGSWRQRQARPRSERDSAEAQRQLSQARADPARLEAREGRSRLLGQLLAPRDAVASGNLGGARIHSTPFFDGVRDEAASRASAGDAGVRGSPDAILAHRDAVTAALARGEGSVRGALVTVEQELRHSLGYPVPSPGAPESPETKAAP